MTSGGYVVRGRRRGSVHRAPAAPPPSLGPACGPETLETCLRACPPILEVQVWAMDTGGLGALWGGHLGCLCFMMLCQGHCGNLTCINSSSLISPEK